MGGALPHSMQSGSIENPEGETPESQNQERVFEHLGPLNRVDCAAGDAYLLSAIFGDSRLMVLSKQLAELSTRIPYDSDSFDIRVNPKYEEVIAAIRERLESEELPVELETVTCGGWNYKLALNKSGNRYIAASTNVRGFPGTDKAESHTRVIRALEDDVTRAIGPLFKKERTVKGIVYQADHLVDYENNLGETVIGTMEHTHEEPSEAWYTFYVYPVEGLEIESLWKTLKAEVAQYRREKGPVVKPTRYVSPVDDDVGLEPPVTTPEKFLRKLFKRYFV